MCGTVAPVDIPGEVYKSSNNRGELSAVLFALRTAVFHKGSFFFDNVIVVSDSEYAIGCMDEHLIAWERKLTTEQIDKKRNIDLIRAASIARASIAIPCKFRHVNSHKVAPADIESEAWFIWRGNYIADELCEIAISRQ
jgi:ribonuclease HI